MDSDIRQPSKNIKFLTYRRDLSESDRMARDTAHSVSNSFPVFRCIGSICCREFTDAKHFGFAWHITHAAACLRGRATLARVRWNMSPYPSRNVHVPRQRARPRWKFWISLLRRSSLPGTPLVLSATLRCTSPAALPVPSFSRRQRLFKQSYLCHVSRTRQLMRDTFAHGVSRRRVLPNDESDAHMYSAKKGNAKKRKRGQIVSARDYVLNDGNQSDDNELVCDDLILGANIATVYTYRTKKVVSEEDKGCARRNGEEIEVGTRCAPTDKHWSQLHVGIELFPSWADHGLLTPARLLRGRRHNW